MPTGDTPDFVRRLRTALPARWFPDVAPVLTGVLTGFAAIWSSLYFVLIYVIRQTRIASASGIFLDMIALDFFQGRIVRNISEPDNHFRLRILSEILRPRATRAAVSQALFDLTGVLPIIFEPADATDTGGYNVGGVGYNVAGGWGSITLPFQAFITAFKPSGGGIANVSGYGSLSAGITATGGLGGYGQGAIEWADLDMVFGAITDADIYATVAAAMPAATIGWTRGLAAGQTQTQQTLRPASAFSRAISSARGIISLATGVLLTAGGLSASRARLVFNTSSSALFAAGFAQGTGRLVPQAGSLFSRGFAASRGVAVRLAGAGLMSARGKTLGFGSGVMSGVLPLFARGFGKSAGNQLYGAVQILGGRGATLIRGTSSIGAVTALRTVGKARGGGYAVVTLVGGASLATLGRASGAGRLTTLTVVSMLSARGKATSCGRAGIITQAAAPTAPTNLTASAATANTMTLTWTPSTGSP